MDAYAFKNMEYGINGVLHVKGKVFRPIIFAKNRCMTKSFFYYNTYSVSGHVLKDTNELIPHQIFSAMNNEN